MLGGATGLLAPGYRVRSTEGLSLNGSTGYDRRNRVGTHVDP